MTDQNKKDLEELHNKCDQIRKEAFFAMRQDLSLSAEQLKHTGHKTHADAVVSAFKYAQKQIDKLTREYLQKYPD